MSQSTPDVPNISVAESTEGRPQMEACNSSAGEALSNEPIVKTSEASVVVYFGGETGDNLRNETSISHVDNIFGGISCSEFRSEQKAPLGDNFPEETTIIIPPSHSHGMTLSGCSLLDADIA